MALVARPVPGAKPPASFSPLQSSIHRPGQIFLGSRIAKCGKTPPWCTKCTIQSRKINGFTENSRNGKRLMTIVRAASIPESEENKDSSFRKILLSDVVVKQRNNVYRDRKWNSLSIATVGVVVAMHLLCVFAPFTFNWGAFWVAVGLYVITGLLGITLSFHRNLSHRSFKVPKWLEYFFAYCGVLSLQVSCNLHNVFRFQILFNQFFWGLWFLIDYDYREIQLTGLVLIDTTISSVILKRIHTVPLKDFGLVT